HAQHKQGQSNPRQAVRHAMTSMFVGTVTFGKPNAPTSLPGKEIPPSRDQERQKAAGNLASPAGNVEASAALLALLALVALTAVALVVFALAAGRELLHPTSVDRLARVDVALRVDGVAMQERELSAPLMSGLSQVRDDGIGVRSRAQHGVEDLVSAV